MELARSDTTPAAGVAALPSSGPEGTLPRQLSNTSGWPPGVRRVQPMPRDLGKLAVRGDVVANRHLPQTRRGATRAEHLVEGPFLG